MHRRTKIVATIGPASSSPETLRALFEAGVNVLRFNFAHTRNVLATVHLARDIANTLNHPLAIMADLQGPKIRIGRFKKNTITLIDGATFKLNCQANHLIGDETQVSVDYQTLCDEIAPGDRLLLDDGLIELEVIDIKSPWVECLVIEGGVLKDHKGINRKGGGLAASALTDKDKRDMKIAMDANVDYIALSFVKSADDIRYARQLLTQSGSTSISIIAKIERTEALQHLTDIILESDGIIVARGDLGVEIGAAEVPGIQKQLIEQTRRLNKIVITATQMMESMITHPQPTRAEVSDVANAILDGTDAVMLSAETASGLYPVKVITMVDKICLSAEKHASFFYPMSVDTCHYQRPDHVIAMAAMHAANHFPIKAILALTESGETAIWMSRIHSTVPIFAVSGNQRTVSKLSVVNNVFPVYLDYLHLNKQEIDQYVIDNLSQRGLIEPGSFVLLTKGRIIGQSAGTNCLEILQV